MVISAPKQMEKILNNTIVEPENKCEALPEYFKCIKSLVSYCHNNPNELDADGIFFEPFRWSIEAIHCFQKIYFKKVFSDFGETCYFQALLPVKTRS